MLRRRRWLRLHGSTFEAGAVSKYVTRAHVSPLLVGFGPERLVGLPLARFQCTEFNRADVRNLLRSINEAADSPVSAEALNRNLRNTWSQLEEDVAELISSDTRALPKADDDYEEDGQSDAPDGVLVQSEKAGQHSLLTSLPVARDLAHYEIAGLVTVTEEVDGKIDVFEFYTNMKRAGVSKLETTLAQKTLISRGMLESV